MSIGIVTLIVIVLVAGAIAVALYVRSRPALRPPEEKAALPEQEPAPEPEAAPAAEPEPEPAPVPEAAPEPEPKPALEIAREPVVEPAPPPEPEPEPTPPPPAEEKPRLFVPPPPKVGPPPRVVVPAPLPKEKPEAPPRPDPEAEARERRRKERARYRKGLAKTRGGFVARLSKLFRGKPRVDADLKEQVEEVLLTADIGAVTADKLLQSLTEVLDRAEIADPEAVWSTIVATSMKILDIEVDPVDPDAVTKPYVLLMIGVNGVGKTTTLGKLALRHAEAGRKVLLVAGDTFRAAAVEQLDVWARRVGCEIHIGKEKADPSSVIFDGIAKARREGFDAVLCDTAGRLHTRKELMDELAKVRRATEKSLAQGGEEGIRYDTFLVLDATIGQNALAQAKMFKETMDFTGLVLTKLDGTAKGGVLLGICDELRVPVRHVGIGERVEDLRDFDPEVFCDALFADRDASHEGVSTENAVAPV